MDAYLIEGQHSNSEFSGQIDCDLDLVRRCFVTAQSCLRGVNLETLAEKVTHEALGWYPVETRLKIAAHLMQPQSDP